MVDMARKEILPAVSGYVKTLAETVVAMRQACTAADASMECELIETLSALNASAWGKIKTLEGELAKARAIADHTAQAMYHKDNVIPAMNALRAVVDEMETLTAASAWPMPTYGDLLFGVN
jgi:glutamine synthetase